MKRLVYIVVIVMAASFVAFGAAWAAEMKEEKNLRTDAAQISATAKTSQGETVVAGRLEKRFNVTNAQITALRNQKLGYGEIAIVCSLAQNMPGGLTDANIQQIMALRQGTPPLGWGEIAGKLNLKLGPAVSQVRNTNRETATEMKHLSVAEQNRERMQERHRNASGGGMEHDSMGGGHGGGMGGRGR